MYSTGQQVRINNATDTALDITARDSKYELIMPEIPL
jgi:hypothetical protein